MTHTSIATTEASRRQFWPKPINFDHSLFMVIRNFGDLGMESVTQPTDTRESIVKDIATGQTDRVVAVFELNPVEKWSRDITADIAEAVIMFNAKRAA